MKTSHWQGLQRSLPRPSRRYERLIGKLLEHDMLDVKRCEQHAIHHMVKHIASRQRGRCDAMYVTAEHFCCSYEKVRKAVYNIDNHINNNKMNRTIKIRNEVDETIIDIEGTIGLSEAWQFDNPDSRVATYERFRQSVSEIADIRNARIRVNIRSTGGDVNDAILIYEALRATGAHVTTCCYGYTASAATIVAQAASQGCRLIAPSSLYLIHNSLCSTEGNAEELQAEVDMLRQTDRRIAEIYATRSGQNVEVIEALMSENGGRGRWLSPAESIAACLVDAIEGAATEEATEPSIVERTKQSLKRLLGAIGVNGDDGHPATEDDVNYIPRQVVNDVAPQPKSSDVTIDFEEHQRAAEPTMVKAVEDPDPVDYAISPRAKAYDGDARRMKLR